MFDKISSIEKQMDATRVRQAQERQRLNQQLRDAKEAKKREKEREKRIRTQETMQEELSPIAKLNRALEKFLKEMQ
jgi:hypothetical protein